MGLFFDQGPHFDGYEPFFTMACEAVCRLDEGLLAEYRSLLDFVDCVREQRAFGFDETLFGRWSNEFDRVQLWSLFLGLKRYTLTKAYDEDAWSEYGPTLFAQMVARSLARDLQREAAAKIIEEKTVANPNMRGEMLHWLDVELAEKRKRLSGTEG
ncbi:MAG: hypothetical protein NW217_03720 [Hyphomicrobiaceae bacterium]|nr:hypothetical protein [Hyphomicrobiaceae bacterium]